MRLPRLLTLLFVVLTLLSCSSGTPAASPSETAMETDPLIQAELLNVDFERAGHATFSETASGIQVSVLLSSVPKGEYRAQLHEFGACEGPGFLSAGKAFFGDSSNTGTDPRFEVSATGLGQIEFLVPRLTMDDILRPGRTAVIVEKLSGDGYGKRFACGVIRPATGGSIEADSLTPGGLSSGREKSNPGYGDNKVHRRSGDHPTPRP